MDKVEKFVHGFTITAFAFLIIAIIFGFYDLPVTTFRFILAVSIPLMGGFIRMSIKA